MAVKGLPQTAQLRRLLGGYDSPTYFSIKTFFFYGIAFILISPGVAHYNGAPQFAAPPLPTRQNESGPICESMDIRNSLDSFAKLRNCEVIEGFLQILLFDTVNETELSKISFPLLTEITDYLVMYRVNGLRSVGQLFPNLALIRGQNTFIENAIVIFEMSTLQEIGLYSLTDITHGSVRIDKNPSLCFVHTIDWDRIVHDKTQKNFLRSLKPENECPICPDHTDGMTSGNNSISVSCHTTQKSIEKDRYLCWNKKHCQKVCPSNCKACNNRGKCCHSSCLACRDDDPQICTVCPKYSIGFGKDKRCMQNCPKGQVGYVDRRCISPEECINLPPRPIEAYATSDIERPYKIHKGSCILQCPPDHTDNYKDHTCDPCGGRCNKTCDGINIDSITVAKQLRGCTHIKGALEIQLRGGINVTELEENLKMIEEISDYLKIVRSFPLVSLNFLKNLRRIRGLNLESRKFVFILLDNQNLQELWDWHNRTLKIDTGKLYFHFNPKLCMEKIEKFRDIVGLTQYSPLEVAPNSNGDKTACNIVPLVVNITNIENKSVNLEWQPFQMDDQRKLLAYIIYIREAPYKNVSMYEGRDACGLDEWRVIDVPSQESQTKISQLLPSLKPYTQYAFYVKTYTIASEKRGSQSEIQYFRTLPSMPSSPPNLQLITKTSKMLMISWSPPDHPNGEITHYIVSGKKHRDGYIFTEDCHERKKQMAPPTAIPEEPLISTTPPSKKDTCQCDDTHQKRISIDEQEEVARMKFEDKLHNEVYQKRPTKKKRSPQEFPKNANRLQTPMYNQIQNITENGTHVWESFNFPVYGQTNFTIDKLHHYTQYDINVQACRKVEAEDEEEDSPCSSTTMFSYKTLPKPGAENISSVKLMNVSSTMVTISWDQPQDPNGDIYLYSVEYRIIDIENSRPYSECVNADKNKTMTYTITKLFPGNYSLLVRTTSSGGVGVSPSINFYIEEPSTNTVLIVCVTLFVFLAMIIFMGWLYRKHQKEKKEMKGFRYVNPEYIPSVYIPDEWEVPRKKIDLIKELGQGSFGMVWEGLAHDIRGKSDIRCAVKTVNEHATDRERLEFLNEASVMKAFDTAHVVRLLGVVSQGQPTLVIMELMANGDLKSYLRSHRPDTENYKSNLIKHPPTLKRILQMAIEIADGMAYLSATKYVHRDLAARNCMVSEDLTVKIGDFGMTRDIYETDYYRKGTKGLLPVRWMAPESLKDGLFASTSDVWSYGVVLWEMATLASQPYQGLSNDQVLRYVIDGGVMERPENCPDKLYTLMRYCWQYKPSSRPSFLKLCQLLLDDASPTFFKVSFYHSPAGIEARAARPTPSPSQDDPSTPLRKVTEKIRGYTPSNSQYSDDLDIDTHHQFPSISESGVGVTTTANGYVSVCPTNGAATTQC
ncbi:hypothetical protein JTB14_006626 [Gonioctena quinquepunctata]|nr:hypothetical protein JTB14_006626 [Gonioctena quinquepunctata]